ncbi:MAG: sugar phosphate nucleotidyltransferase [Candidatus Woesebacteria bacterium]|nr:sugar phosphate nucleotidyltransferase [Candidatus Woesebacteria bacterium]
MSVENRPEMTAYSSINVNKHKETRVLLAEPPNLFPADAHRRPNGSLGPVCLGGALREMGMEFDYLDATVGKKEDKTGEVFYRNNEPNEKGLSLVGMNDDEIRNSVKGYDIVAVTNIFTPQTNTALRFGQLVKEVNPSAVLLAGGVNAWSLPDRFLENGYDAIGVGEGEKIICDIAASVAKKENWRNTPGLITRTNGETKYLKLPNTSLDLSKLPEPAYNILPLEKYWKISAPHGGDFPLNYEVRYGSIETSRGCVFNCSYCHISELKNFPNKLGSLRLRPITDVVRDIEKLKSLGVEWLFFEDDSLLAVPERAMKIFEEVKSLGLNLADVNGVNLVHLFKRNSGGKLEVNVKLLESMTQAGFKQLVLPFESGSQRIIDRYASKKWNIEQTDVIQLVKEAKKLGLKVPGNFMIGFPDENEKELQSTIDMAKKLIDNGLTYASFFIVVPYPGSKLFQEAIKNKLLDTNFDADQFHWGNPVMKNTTIAPEKLVSLRKQLWEGLNNSDYVDGKMKRQVVPNSNVKKNSEMKGIILGGGRGTRLKPLTNYMSKLMVPVGRFPMFVYPLLTLINSGVDEIAIVVDPTFGYQIEKYIKEHKINKNILIKIYQQEKALGLPDAIRSTKKFVGNDNLVVVGGDNLFGGNYGKYLKQFVDGDVSFLRNVPDANKCAVPIYKKGQLVNIVEKPKSDKYKWAITGPHIFDNSIFSMIEKLEFSARGELEIADIHKMYLSRHSLKLIKSWNYWRDVGTYRNLLQAYIDIITGGFSINYDHIKNTN